MKRQLLLLIFCAVFLTSCSLATTDGQISDTDQILYESDTEAVTDEPCSLTVYESANYTLCEHDVGYTLYDNAKNPVGTFDEYHTVEAYDFYGSIEELHYLVKNNGDGTYALFALDENGPRTELAGVSSIQFFGDFIVAGDHLHTSRLDMIGMFGQIKGVPHEQSPKFNEGIIFDGMMVTYFDTSIGFDLPTEDIDYIDTVNISTDEYTCFFEANGTLTCRVFKPVSDSIYPNGRYMVQYDHPAVHIRDFGEYSHYMGNGVSWILHDGKLIFSGFGEFADVQGLPIFTQSYHNGYSTLFDKNFNPTIDSIAGYAVLQDGNILLHRREPTFVLPESTNDKSELISVKPDGSSKHLGTYKYIHALIGEGSFALVSTMADESVHTLMLVDTGGNVIQTLGTLDPSFTYTDFSDGDGEWIFHFFNRTGEHITYEYIESNK